MGWAEERLPLGVCPGNNSQHLINRDPRPCLRPSPHTSRNKHCHPPSNWRQARAVAPNLLALLPRSLAREGVARQGKGDTQVAPHPGGSPLPQGPQPLLFFPDPKFLPLTSHPQAQAVLCPGGEDSLIKVFRNAGGWRLRRGGCNLENWFQCVFPLWPLGPAGGR